jgi:hypothetical protein
MPYMGGKELPMAVTARAANVTKVVAGGSGDNVVSDGLIKTVEKVWTDTYAVSAAITSAANISIAKLTKGKKLTSVLVSIPALGTVTSATIQLGDGTDQDAFGKVTNWDTTAETLFQLPNLGMLAEMSADTDSCISFDPATTLTGVTIK